MPITVEGRSREAVSNMVLILGVDSVIVIAFHYLNLWVLNLWRAKASVDFSFSMHEIFFFQGILLILSGLIAFIGRIKEVREHGWSLDLKEIFWGLRVFKWVPGGYPRIGLTFIISGIIMILIYFSSL